MPEETFKDKLRSLSFSKGKRGTAERRPVINEDTGKVGGSTTEHWDDHVDAQVNLDTVKVKAVKEET